MLLVLLTFSPRRAPHHPRFRSAVEPGLVSVIVPTRHEGPNIAALVDLARSRRPPWATGATEVLFVDDSDDDTPDIVGRVAPGVVAPGPAAAP